MSDSENAMAGATAPVDTGERMSAPDPRHAPAIAQPVYLANADAERLRARITALLALADELGIFLATITMHQVSEPSAHEAFPEGHSTLHTMSSRRRFCSWDVDVGHHQVRLFTGNTDIDAINAETTP
jgi:hypothetical protein